MNSLQKFHGSPVTSPVRPSLWIVTPLLVILTGTHCSTANHSNSHSMGAASAASGATGSAAAKPVAPKARTMARVGTKGMVVADDEIAAEWGVEILKRGGNAVDAAVATAFAMAVTRPHFASLGGGGFMVYCPAPKAGKPVPNCESIDYREMAPAATGRDFYIDKSGNGKPRTDLSQNGATASGVPGVPAGLLLALEKFGTRKRAELLTRPIQLAQKGYLFTGHSEEAALDRWDEMNPEAKKLFGCAGFTGMFPCPPGTLITQTDLAKVLQAISKSGKAGFYQGWVAKKLIQGLHEAGGVMTLEDLAGYEAKLRKPVTGTFQGLQVISMPPPSSGGAILLQILSDVERADKTGSFAQGPRSASSIHAITHAMALAFADRAKYFGDPDQTDVPLAQLLDTSYLDPRWQKSFDPKHARLPAGAGELTKKEPTHTTHFSVMDHEGNAVAITTTVNDNFGSGFVPPGTGVVMNDQMDDFSIQPGTPNMFGLVGAEANAVAPHKRPLSSMSPTIVRTPEGQVRLIVGAQGGPKIITAVAHTLINRLRFNMTLSDAVAEPRYHQQWKPASLSMESGFAYETQKMLRELGYDLQESGPSGKIHALERDLTTHRVYGVSDPRAEGAAVAEP
ncbi:MAG: gamma-glutamyltransferase [Methylotenera sp.]|nr:gamma-glutamyltransferase [Oligoflexia bacterium]